MNARAAILAILLLCATSASAARLVLGPEVPVGSHERGLAQLIRTPPAIASDGDELFVVYTTGGINQHFGLHAARFDRHGARRTSEAIVLVPRNESFGVWSFVGPRVVWAGGHYVVFFAGSDGKGHAVRVTRDGSVVARAVVAPSAQSWEQFDVATDGDEIVLVSASDQLLRIGADLRVLGTVPIARVDRTSTQTRGIAFGDGRFVIVTADAKSVTSRFLRDGVLTAPVHLGSANNEDTGPVRVTWTGTTFVAAWMEASNDVYNLALPVWTPLTPTGEAAGPLRAIEFLRDQFSLDDYAITVTPLDEETVFISWGAEAGTKTRGQRLRLSGSPVGGVVELGVSPAGAFRSPGGALVLFDGALRMATIEAPAVAPLTDPLPLAPGVLMFPNELLLAAAATRDEVAIARGTWRDQLFYLNDSAIAVMSHDGSNVRELRVVAREVALATDGRAFFALLADGRGALWFQGVSDPARRVRLDSGGNAHSPRLAWNGSELVAMWTERDRVWVTRLGRDGQRVADDAVFGTDEIVQLSGSDGRVLLAWYRNSVLQVATLNRDGRTTGVPVDLPFRGSQAVLATDGTRDVYASVTQESRVIGVAIRPVGGSFHVAPPDVRHQGQNVYEPSAAVVADRVLVAYGTWDHGYAWTRIALLDAEGRLEAREILGTGRWGPVAVLPTGPRSALAVYVRTADEQPYAGLTRVFLRTVAIEDDVPRRRAVRR